MKGIALLMGLLVVVSLVATAVVQPTLYCYVAQQNGNETGDNIENRLNVTKERIQKLGNWAFGILAFVAILWVAGDFLLHREDPARRESIMGRLKWVIAGIVIWIAWATGLILDLIYYLLGE